MGLSPEYKKLNRFANITVCKLQTSIKIAKATSTVFNSPFICTFPDDHNRILLNPISGHDDCKGEFVNACYIDVS